MVKQKVTRQIKKIQESYLSFVLCKLHTDKKQPQGKFEILQQRVWFIRAPYFLERR